MYITKFFSASFINSFQWMIRYFTNRETNILSYTDTLNYMIIHLLWLKAALLQTSVRKIRSDPVLLDVWLSVKYSRHKFCLLVGQTGEF